MWKVYEHEERVVNVAVVRDNDLKPIGDTKYVYPTFFTVEDREAGPKAYVPGDGTDKPKRFTDKKEAVTVCANLLLKQLGDNRNDA